VQADAGGGGDGLSAERLYLVILGMALQRRGTPSLPGNQA
jgi:hypothetical protein